jgi:hypothetical protein
MGHLCSNRNKDSVKKIEALGVNADLVLAVVEQASCRKVRAAFLELFVAMYADVDPFISL